MHLLPVGGRKIVRSHCTICHYLFSGKVHFHRKMIERCIVRACLTDIRMMQRLVYCLVTLNRNSDETAGFAVLVLWRVMNRGQKGREALMGIFTQFYNKFIFHPKPVALIVQVLSNKYMPRRRELRDLRARMLAEYRSLREADIIGCCFQHQDSCVENFSYSSTVQPSGSRHLLASSGNGD